MPQKAKNQKTKIAHRKLSPFKSRASFEKEITIFANKHKTTMRNHSKRISDYFEINCFNHIVRFYELRGYTTEVKNLINGEYRYKCSTAGIQSNFSFFQTSITIKKGHFIHEIHHNLAAQSSHSDDIFTTPDITVIKGGTVQMTRNYYDSGKRFSYVKNHDLVTFCEAKHYTPFPELVFNFIGIVNEIKNEHLSGNGLNFDSPHIAPTLMISGKSNKQTSSIKQHLENRYCINIIYNVFYYGSRSFTRRSVSQLRIIGKNPVS